MTGSPTFCAAAAISPLPVGTRPRLQVRLPRRRTRATVHREHGTRDVAGRVAGQEEGGAGDVLGPPDPAECHPVVFGRDSRKAVLEKIGVISSQRAYTARTPLETIYAHKVPGIRALLDESRNWPEAVDEALPEES